MIDEKTDSIINTIPPMIKSNFLSKISIGYANNWKNYNTGGCYIDIPETNILYSSLKIKNQNLNIKNITGVNSHYPMNGFTRVYLDNLNADLANKYVILWYLAIKDKNAY